MKESIVKCEHPVIIFNHDIIYLMTVKKCAAEFRGSHIQLDYSLCSFNFPWPKFYAWKSQVTVDTVDEASLYDEDGVRYPLFLVVPCGKCRLCKSQQKYDWETRCMCESATSKYPPLFITLTYDPLRRPSDMQSVLVDFQKFMKRLRINVSRRLNQPNHELRYLAVSEWTPDNHYPHIHMLLWNMPFIKFNDGSKSFWQLVKFIQEDCWQNGITKVERARDCSGRYCLKYMVKCDHEDGCWRLSSRRPGIGYDFCMQLLPQVIKNPDMMSFRVPDGTGKTVVRGFPAYFKRLLFPSLSQLFPAAIIRALKDFRELTNKMYYFYQVFGFAHQVRSIEALHQELSSKFYQLHINWLDAKPSQAWISDVLWLFHHKDAKEHPLRVDYSDIFESDFPFDSFYNDVSNWFRPYIDNPVTSLRAYNIRLDVVRSHNRLYELWFFLDKYQPDYESIQYHLDLKDIRSQCLLRLSKDFKKYDIDAEVHMCEVDKAWIETHWLQH